MRSKAEDGSGTARTGPKSAPIVSAVLLLSSDRVKINRRLGNRFHSGGESIDALVGITSLPPKPIPKYVVSIPSALDVVLGFVPKRSNELVD